MVNIIIKRGQKEEKDVTVYAIGSTTNSANLFSGYTASLVIRTRDGKKFNGDLVDKLTSASSGDGANRIEFLSFDANSANVRLKWSTANSSALTNIDQKVFGDLKITNNSTQEVEFSKRLSFTIKEEIV